MPLPTNADIDTAIHTICKVVNKDSGNHRIDIPKTKAVFDQISAFYDSLTNHSDSSRIVQNVTGIHRNVKKKLKELADACGNIPKKRKRPMFNKEKRDLVQFLLGHLCNLQTLLNIIDQQAESQREQSTARRIGATPRYR